MQQIIEHNKQILNCNRAEFQQIFGVPLTKFMHPLSGFDIVSFDIWLGTPDGVSIANYLKATRGQVALSIVERLI